MIRTYLHARQCKVTKQELHGLHEKPRTPHDVYALVLMVISPSFILLFFRDCRKSIQISPSTSNPTSSCQIYVRLFLDQMLQREMHICHFPRKKGSLPIGHRVAIQSTASRSIAENTDGAMYDIGKLLHERLRHE